VRLPRGKREASSIMQTRIDKATLVRRVAQRAHRDEATVDEIIDATLEEIYEALRQGEPVSLRQFGSFYVRPQSAQWVFRFNPAQRLRRAFGWSSTTQGK
jgi:DNA-binding protein HU-beta